jgi:RHS repeat-associated protein
MYADAETGLYYNMARYYDPKIGRYISSDPIGLAGGLNTYGYAYNNPLRWTDPTGLMGFGGGGSANASKPLSLPGNGNVWGGPSRQDMVCTKPMITLNLCVKDCCIAHNECYARNGCNWSSWAGNLAGTSFACQQCNAKAVRCVFSAIGRCDKYPCMPPSLSPFIAP